MKLFEDRIIKVSVIREQAVLGLGIKRCIELETNPDAKAWIWTAIIEDSNGINREYATSPWDVFSNENEAILDLVKWIAMCAKFSSCQESNNKNTELNADQLIENRINSIEIIHPKLSGLSHLFTWVLNISDTNHTSTKLSHSKEDALLELVKFVSKASRLT